MSDYDYYTDTDIGHYTKPDEMKQTSYGPVNMTDTGSKMHGLASDLITDRNALIKRNAELRAALAEVTADRNAFALALARKVSV